MSHAHVSLGCQYTGKHPRLCGCGECFVKSPLYKEWIARFNSGHYEQVWVLGDGQPHADVVDCDLRGGNI